MNRGRILGEWLAAQDSQAFDWATANCCHFAARWVLHAEGFDPMASLATTKTGRAALALVRKLGGMEAAWTQQLGRSPILPTLAQVGDVVLAPADGETGHVLGICNGSHFLVLDEAGAAVFLPMEAATCAWRIEPREVQA